MDKNFIRYVANLYYKENVEGEPLDQDVPIECFVAGANFILKAQKIHTNNCNILYVSPYNLKKLAMTEKEEMQKILINVQNIITVKGFYITAPGDPSVGINPSTWELKNDFYFDNLEELEIFRGEIKSLFEFYCGEVTNVITFEEHQKMIKNDELEYFRQYPVRYLLRDKESSLNLYKQANSTASYSSDVGTAIHHELPNWIPVDGSSDTEVIKSTENRYKQILLTEAERLENEIRNEEYRLRIAKKNLSIIQKELNIGLK
jgi:hypothetical protein